MSIQETIEKQVKNAVTQVYKITLEQVEFQPTRKYFECDITLVTFPMLRQIKTNPVQLGQAIGDYLVENVPEVVRFNVVQGFLNIVLSDSYFLSAFFEIKDQKKYGRHEITENSKSIMVEYSSPNTNKPLHLGHVRNNLLGYSVAEILKASGNKVYKTQIINDRGIHICKSMLAWKRFGNGETPETTGLKGDKLVGNYYVKFDQEYKKEISELIAEGKSEAEAKAQAPILIEAQEMLIKWEAGDPEVIALWKKMNRWVYEGFEKTYNALGVDFDKNYYESETYLLGKEVVEQGLKKGVFFKKEDGSVWIDLTAEGLDEKIVLRSDGTAVYMTQDIGTAIQRVKDFDIDGMVYTVGNEQDYHFKVLFLILKKLGFDWSNYLFHLSYGMVDLPEGKMKSREGTVVDADDLIEQMRDTAKTISEELGKLDGYSEEEKEELYKIIGLGALKYYILKVDPKKRILFNPEESVDFQGNTGPFIQYTYARIQSILRKAEELDLQGFENLAGQTGNDLQGVVALDDLLAGLNEGLHPKEKELIKQLQLFPETIQLAAGNLSPALIANYTYDLVKEFNSFYQQVSILGEEDGHKKLLRVELSRKVGQVIKSAFGLLGIEVPERM